MQGSDDEARAEVEEEMEKETLGNGEGWLHLETAGEDDGLTCMAPDLRRLSH